MNEYTFPILFGLIVGTLARMYMLRTDYRQYPTYPHGIVIHLALGFIASALGTLAVPSIMEEDFTAVTFLTLAASQFREVRNMERNTLKEMDEMELVPRGNSYIEGIAVTFEGRNYLVIFTSLLSTLFYLIFNLWIGIIVAVLSLLIAKKFMSGSRLKDIANIRRAEIRFEGAGLYVDNIYIMNIGLEARQEEILSYGMGFIAEPKNFNGMTTISNLGQRQAILHDLTVLLGIYRDSGTPALVPLIKRDLENGRIGIFILPKIRDEKKAIRVLENVPTLEYAIRVPTETEKNRKKEGLQ